MTCWYLYASLNYLNFFLFRITAVCGDYYIGGRQFDSLSDLIGYYTSWSDLLKKERLAYPVPPPEVSSAKGLIFYSCDCIIVIGFRLYSYLPVLILNYKLEKRVKVMFQINLLVY